MVRMVPRAYKKKKKWRIVSLWILGSFCMLVGSMVAGQLQRMTGGSGQAGWDAQEGEGICV